VGGALFILRGLSSVLDFGVSFFGDLQLTNAFSVDACFVLPREFMTMPSFKFRRAKNLGDLFKQGVEIKATSQKINRSFLVFLNSNFFAQ
jgi:hypothetical protein